MKYYAGYDSKNTDVCVFETEKERDDWIANKYYKLDTVFDSAENMDEYLSDIHEIYGTDKRIKIPEHYVDNGNFLEENDIFGMTWFIHPQNFLI